MIQRTSTALTRLVRPLLIASLAALALTLPNPISETRVANAADAPSFMNSASRLTTKDGTKIFLIHDSGNAAGGSFSPTPADASRFTVLVDNQSTAVTAVSNGPDCAGGSCYIITLTLATTIPVGAQVTIEYSNAGTTEPIKSRLGKLTPAFGPLSVTNRSEAVTGAPGTPGVASVVAGEESATITVSAPTSGSAPTSYTVTASPGGKTCTVTGASGSCTIDGLTAGTAYTFSTVATNASGSSAAGTASDSVTALVKTATTTPSTTTDTTGLTTSAASWDVEPATESEFDTNTEGFFPNPLPGMSIITNEFGFVIDKKGGIKPKIRMKSYAGRIAMTITAKYKVAGKTKNYKCTFKPFGTAKKVKSVKWRWYTPKKACILPKPLIEAVQKGETKISAKGKWNRQWLTSGKKARPNKSKIKPRTLKYTMRAKPAVVK